MSLVQQADQTSNAPFQRRLSVLFRAKCIHHHVWEFLHTGVEVLHRRDRGGQMSILHWYVHDLRIGGKGKRSGVDEEADNW